jgi:hypothetical protein
MRKGGKVKDEKFDIVSMEEIKRVYDSGADIPWLHFLHRNYHRSYVVSLEELYVRRAYGFFRRGLIFEAASALSGATVFVYEISEVAWERLSAAVPDMAWRGSLLIKDKDVVEERPGEAALFLRGGENSLERMPMAVLSSVGWEPEERAEFHGTLWVTEELLKTELPIGSLEDILK